MESSPHASKHFDQTMMLQICWFNVDMASSPRVRRHCDHKMMFQLCWFNAHMASSPRTKSFRATNDVSNVVSQRANWKLNARLAAANLRWAAATSEFARVSQAAQREAAKAMREAIVQRALWQKNDVWHARESSRGTMQQNYIYASMFHCALTLWLINTHEQVTRSKRVSMFDCVHWCLLALLADTKTRNATSTKK